MSEKVVFSAFLHIPLTLYRRNIVHLLPIICHHMESFTIIQDTLIPEKKKQLNTIFQSHKHAQNNTIYLPVVPNFL